MRKIISTIFVLFVFAVILSGCAQTETANQNNKENKNIITSNVKDLLIKPSDVPTEWYISKTDKNVSGILNISGVNDEISIAICRGVKKSECVVKWYMFPIQATKVTFTILKFNTTEEASSIWSKLVNEIRDGRGYEEITTLDNCFSYSKKGRHSICKKKNIIYIIKAEKGYWSDDNLDNILKEMTEKQDKRIK